MDLRIGEHYARLGDVLDGVLRAAVLPGNAADRAGEVVAFQRLHIGYLKQDENWKSMGLNDNYYGRAIEI